MRVAGENMDGDLGVMNEALGHECYLYICIIYVYIYECYYLYIYILYEVIRLTAKLHIRVLVGSS